MTQRNKIAIQTEIAGASVIEVTDPGKCLLEMEPQWGDCVRCIFLDKPCQAYTQYRTGILTTLINDIKKTFKRISEKWQDRTA